MTIPIPLPQFEKKRALIIAAGKQRARMYAAGGSEIREIDRIEIETPKYSDREGFFIKSGSGRTYGAGAPYENRKQRVETDFLKELDKKLKKHLDKYDEAYLFCPNYMHKMIEAVFPKGKRDKLKEVFFGNIVDTSPLKFVRMIGETMAAPPANPASGEARAVLRKARAARKVIKRKS